VEPQDVSDNSSQKTEAVVRFVVDRLLVCCNLLFACLMMFAGNLPPHATKARGAAAFIVLMIWLWWPSDFRFGGDFRLWPQSASMAANAAQR